MLRLIPLSAGLERFGWNTIQHRQVGVDHHFLSTDKKDALLDPFYRYQSCCSHFNSIYCFFIFLCRSNRSPKRPAGRLIRPGRDGVPTYISLHPVPLFGVGPADSVEPRLAPLQAGQVGRQIVFFRMIQ